MIGIIGFGRFGKLTARYLAEDFEVKVYTAPGKTDEVVRLGSVVDSLEAVCAQKLVILCVPISAMEPTLKRIAPMLNPGTVVVDVCSVKTLPARWMTEALPDHVSILATHPMFGPDSAADSLSGRKIVLCRVRIEEKRFDNMLAYLTAKGLKVFDTSPEEHDRQIAVTLALTHFIGRSLARFGAEDLPIDTEGYKRLRHILGVVENDTWQLFEDMNRYNPYAQDARKRFMAAMSDIDGRLE
ncbi:MAG: prephenate dehydrogenase/arogenate dehydrogenase family protein [Desulfobacterales bacterium]|nr:prephenate dehydrogenase/arogenate dehydrogenase family protein [Desulfobacterales bacterium]